MLRCLSGTVFENVQFGRIVCSFILNEVANEIRSSFLEVSESVFVAAGHGEELASEEGVEFDRFPGVIDSIVVVPSLRNFLGMELGSHEGILLALDRGNKGSVVSRVERSRGHVPHFFEACVCLEG